MPVRFALTARASIALLAVACFATAPACGSGGSGGSQPGGQDAATGSDAQPDVTEAGASESGGGGDTGSSHDTGTGSDAADAASSPESGADSGIAPGQPITAPAEQWTFVPFPDAFCGNGSSTGIGINPTTKSSRVLIYLEGGGACWSALTCFTEMTAANFTSGYGPSNFAADQTALETAGGFFDRTDAQNPFKDYSYVYVPYCTGDLHAGNNVAMYAGGADGGTLPAYHVGWANMRAYLSRLIATFASPQRITLAGSSAGGLGALIDWSLVSQAFAGVRVDVVDDSGTPMPADVPVQYYGQQYAAWNLAGTLPPACPQCATTLAALFPYSLSAFPTSTLALLSYVQDSTLPAYYGITTAQFTSGLQELLTNDFVPTTRFKSFTVSASGHVLFFTPQLTVSGVTLQQFLTKMATDDPTWATVP